MKIHIHLSALGRSRWYEYLIRFAFGGAVTALTGIIAKSFGPEIGGLFLAFPAVLPATATLIEKHEKLKKERAGKAGTLRAREIAGVDAAGAAMGSTGLLAFAVVVWQGIPKYPVALVLCAATLAWLLAAVLTWEAHDSIVRKLRARFSDRGKSTPGQRLV